jgi:spore germination cell wall hydrolase CwlJ-like protein
MKFLTIVFMSLMMAFSAQASDSQHTRNELNCLSRAVYWEARGEGERGMRAVAHVVMNRKNNPRFPSNVCGVVYQRRGNVCQFSWACTHLRTQQIAPSAQWQLAQRIARSVYFEQPDITDGSLYFHARYVRPSWRHAFEEVAEYGNHIFYRER